MLNKKSTFIPTNKTLANGEVRHFTQNESSFLEAYAQLCLEHELEFTVQENMGEIYINVMPFTNRSDNRLDLFWGL